jgi:hypothetical protein
MIAPAATRNGQNKTVHTEFDDGYAIGVFEGCSYIPLVFRWQNPAFDDCESAVLASDKLYHDRLMRNDGGEQAYYDSEVITFDWFKLSKVTLGYSKNPNTLENEEVWGYCYEEASDAAIDGIISSIYDVVRKDRDYWTPGHTIQNATGPEELFGLDQLNPRTCPHGPNCDLCNGKYGGDVL